MESSRTIFSESMKDDNIINLCDYQKGQRQGQRPQQMSPAVTPQLIKRSSPNPYGKYLSALSVQELFEEALICLEEIQNSRIEMGIIEKVDHILEEISLRVALDTPQLSESLNIFKLELRLKVQHLLPNISEVR